MDYEELCRLDVFGLSDTPKEMRETNVREALEGLPPTSIYCWLDSSVAFYWIRGQGEHKQFN